MDIQNDKAKDPVQHQELETDSKQYNDKQGKENGYTVSAGQDI
ncbi:hypothetical protein A2U01_0044415, partial [Trifolium medium]|nr:hypothetical protein [Trifolium medium]